ncbi:hypothetical protein [Palleronia pelagia]|uniref:hypothetical protein n=1 Tax=Palleronia pelagia TaxID=387096 RepID=UPI001113B617|nr:hypothetical protein [Palleronia pelagia]
MNSKKILHLAMYVPSILFLVVWYSGGRSEYYRILNLRSNQLVDNIFSSPALAINIAIYFACSISLLLSIFYCLARLVVAGSRDKKIINAITAGIIFIISAFPASFIFLLPPTAGAQLKLNLFPVGLIIASLVFGYAAMTIVLFKYSFDLSKAAP